MNNINYSVIKKDILIIKINKNLRVRLNERVFYFFSSN